MRDQLVLKLLAMARDLIRDTEKHVKERASLAMRAIILCMASISRDQRGIAVGDQHV